jgi:hypothetical protein
MHFVMLVVKHVTVDKLKGLVLLLGQLEFGVLPLILLWWYIEHVPNLVWVVDKASWKMETSTFCVKHRYLHNLQLIAHPQWAAITASVLVAISGGECFLLP